MTTARWFGWMRAAAIGAAALAIFAAGARACLWDTDTLRAEAAGLPGVVEIITGRFDRFPPEYYEVRLARVESEVGQRPGELELYDDAAVALDRLGRGDEAIAWMGRKLEAIERAESAGEDAGEHRYRYLANLGTFHVHRWIRGGADREDMADVERARDLIAAAIELNPDAHFGRERYQLLAIEWILNPPDSEFLGHVPLIFDADEVLYRSDYYHPNTVLAGTAYSDAVEGLTGLVVLGNAWESVDIFHALTAALIDHDDASLAYLAQLRRGELVGEGRGTLYPVSGEEPGWVSVHSVFDEQIEDITSFYRDARAEAESWRQSRNAFVLERLAQGEHPDTHPGFWDAWIETSTPPALPSRPSGASYGSFGIVKFTVGFAAVVVGVACVVIAIVLVMARRARVRTASGVAS